MANFSFVSMKGEVGVYHIVITNPGFGINREGGWSGISIILVI